ncbi:MAG: RNA polymerase sigma factor [Candidatus Rifleibacteriota bacterium]
MTKDDDLIKRLQTGEVKAVEDLIDSYGRFVYAKAWAMVRNQADAEDIYQNVFVRVFRFAASIKKSSSIKSWLARITYNCGIDLIRQQKKSQNTFHNLKKEDISSEFKSPKEVRESFLTIIAPFKESERKILIYRFIFDLSYKEIAELCDVPVGTLRNMVWRVLKALRQELQR